MRVFLGVDAPLAVVLQPSLNRGVRVKKRMHLCALQAPQDHMGLAVIWTPPNRNIRVNAEVLFYGNSISNWQLRVEEGASVGRERRLKLALLEQCTECGPAMRDSLLKAWGN